MSAGSRRQEAARARLSARMGAADDAELTARALQAVGEAVERRDPPTGDEANVEVAAEMRKMRAERRAKAFVAAQHRE